MLSKIKLKYFLYIAMILYVGFLGVSVAQIDTLMEYSRGQLSVAKDRTRDIKSRINEQQNVVPGLLATPELAYSDMVVELSRQEHNRQRIMNLLKENYPGDKKTLDALQEAFRQYQIQVRKLASRMEDNTNYHKGMQAFTQELLPYIRQIMAYINEIDAYVKEVSLKTDKKIHFRMNLLIGLSLGFGSLILLMFILADKKEDAKNREIAYREKLFNQLSQNVDEVFIVASSADDFAYVSPNSKNLLGESAEAIQENPELLYSLLPSPELANWLRNKLENVEETQTILEQEIDIPELKKSFRLRLYPIGVISGRNERFILSFSDQTQSIRHQEALSVALENAHAASFAKSSFLSHMSHEIRTPMNAIIGMTTIALTRLGDTAKVRDCLDKISASSRHLLGLINDVLDMSKIESGKLSLNYEQFNLMNIVSHIRNTIQPQTVSRQLDFNISIDGVTEEELVGDTLRLNQILLNLLSNAYKFTPAGGKISLNIKQISQKTGKLILRFEVKDSGIGMSQEYLDRLYAPFEQASASTTSTYGGTGLGMPITANLVSLMGGTIQVESKEGEGTKFTVELPFGIAVSTSGTKRELPELNVLVVDDDPGTCEHATLLLRKMGMKTEYAHSGFEAVEKVRNALDVGNSFDVCLIDWKMPDMDGAETARKIRQLAGANMLIIIISAFDLSEIEQEARVIGVNDFIAKPFFSSTLYDSLINCSRKLSKDKAEPANQDKPESPDFGGKKVLLVEDNEFNREIGQEFLELANIQVETAVNGQEAVNMLSKAQPGYYSLVLMDIQMPVMDGYAATKAFRSSSHPEAATLPILAMTANAFSEDISKAAAAGMNTHISKPIDIKLLYKKLAEYLR